MVSKEEAVQATDDYFAGKIDKPQALTVVMDYFNEVPLPPNLQPAVSRPYDTSLPTVYTDPYSGRLYKYQGSEKVAVSQDIYKSSSSSMIYIIGAAILAIILLMSGGGKRRK